MNLIDWLLEGDISIQYQTKRDLLGKDLKTLKNKIHKQGFAKRLLDLQKPDGHWSNGYYAYKWICTHYTLLELRRLEINNVPSVDKVIEDLLDNYKVQDGGITANPHAHELSDICLNGMLLFIFCYFGANEEKMKSMVDRILEGQIHDGGFNCNYQTHQVKHSSLHSTVSMIEGFNEYLNNGYTYRKQEIIESRKRAIEFILMHQLYLSDHTGEVINPDFIKLSYPPRYKYDILRAFEAMRVANTPYDTRMDKALEVLLSKQRKDKTWPVQKKHAGKVHFDMEKIGGPSRWNTLRVLRVFKYYQPDTYHTLIKKEW